MIPKLAVEVKKGPTVNKTNDYLTTEEKEKEAAEMKRERGKTERLLEGG